MKKPTQPVWKLELPLKYWYLVGITKVRESLYTQVIIWVNAILIPYKHRVISLTCIDSWMVFKPKWY